MICECEDWIPGNAELNKHMGLWLTHSHAWGDPEYYDYKRFIYCPWCGKKLKEEEANESKRLY